MTHAKPSPSTLALLALAIVLLATFPASPVVAADAGASARQSPDARAALDRALAYLKSQQQPDGSWQRNPREPLAITALVLRAFALDEKTGPKADFVKKGYGWLLAQ